VADIFISYSSKDRDKAEQLTEMLSSAGLSVWIDKQGIEVATSWSKEIVQAIDSCKALVVLLSPNSVVSINVAKEVSLAAEQKKKILPLDLEPVELTDDLRYHLAGLQRAPMTNTDNIIRAIAKLGLEATQAPTLKLVKETDGRKSLMILPFEDLSPTGDNGWFADGIVSELINMLSHIKSLRLTDQQETKSFKSFKGHLTEYARTMQIRYFVQGSVRKFGDQIKITTQLLDIDSGDHLWQDSLKGTMDDIFELQETVANKVVEGLKLHLTTDERQKFAERGTENVEAYELFLKSTQYYSRVTKESLQLATQLLTDAISIDPTYAQAYQMKASSLMAIYRLYDRNPALITEAEALCRKSLELKPDLYFVYHPLSQIYTYRGMLAEAEEAAKEYVRKDPQNYYSHFSLGYFYNINGEIEKTIAPYEEAARLKPNFLTVLFNLVNACSATGNQEKCIYWAEIALPQYERFLRLHPDDEIKQVSYANLLSWCGRVDEAREAALKLTGLKNSLSLYNIACLFKRIGDPENALQIFRKSIETGQAEDIRSLKEFLDNKKHWADRLIGTVEYEEVVHMVEEIERNIEAQKTGG
jgi:adenylate cyclase